MANAQVLYAESVAATTATSTTWVDLASIPASSFTANKKYLILATEICKQNSASNETRIRLVHGTTPTVFDDASVAYEEASSVQEHCISYMFMYTQPGTTELVKLQISTSGVTTVTNILSQIIAINMDDVGTDGTDYFWNEVTADYTMTATPTDQAKTASFTPNGSDRWLFIGNMIYDVVSITDDISMRLNDSVAGNLVNDAQEGEDATNDFISHNLYWAGVPSNAARTVAIQSYNEGGSNIALATRVIAINLAKFAQSASVFSASEVDPATSPSWTNIATIAPTPTNTGNWVVIASMIADVNELASDFETRLQINPAGGGLADDPPYTNTAPGQDSWDAIDEVQFSVFNLVSLTSGAARTINFDARRVAGTTGRIEDIGLVAFSVALAGMTVTLGQLTETGTLQATSKTKARAMGQLVETDTLQVTTKTKLLTLLQLLETNTLQPLSRLKQITLGQLLETGTLFPITRPGQTVILGLLTETGLLQSTQSAKSRTLGQLAETESLQVLQSTKSKTLGQLQETDALLSVIRQKILTLGLLAETDSLFGLSRLKNATLGQLLENGTIFPLTLPSIIILGLLTESETLFSFNRMHTASFGLLVESDELLPIIRLKTRTISQLIESSSVQSITALGVVNLIGRVVRTWMKARRRKIKKGF